MKIISYNINGIRSSIRNGLLNCINEIQPDIICFQEIKANISQINTKKFNDLNYYNYWFSAKKNGYSGVAILSKAKPYHIEYGIGIDYIDNEGRIMRLDFEKFSIISVYIPSGSNKINRLKFKLSFLRDFYFYIKKLKKKINKLIISGDYNICHKYIDIYDPIKNLKKSGFLKIERKWMSRFIELGFIDSFRFFIKKPFFYSWWSYRYNSRSKNNGWRIDYQMVSDTMEKNIYKASILNNYINSDHCPIFLELKFF